MRSRLEQSLFPADAITLSFDGAYTLDSGQAAAGLIERTTTTGAAATLAFPGISEDFGVMIVNNCGGMGRGALTLVLGSFRFTIPPDRAGYLAISDGAARLSLRHPRTFEPMAPVAYLPPTPPTRTGDATPGANVATGFSFTVTRPFKVRRVRIRVATASGALSAAIYDMTRKQIVTSGAVAPGISAKALEFALPPTTLLPGAYQLWISTSDGTVSLGVNSTYGDLVMGETMTSAHPLPAALAGVTLSAQQVSSVALPDDPVGLALAPVYARTDLGVSVIGQRTSNGRLYGTNLTTGHFVYSDNNGDAWTDTSVSPVSVTPNVINLYFDTTNVYAVTSDGKIFRNTIDTWTSWTDVSAPTPAGTTGRPDCLAVSGSTLLYGNYNADPAAAGAGNVGAHIYRSTDAGANWTAVLDAANGRHVHAVYVDPANAAHIFATVGDGNYADAGLYYSADTGATWNKLSGGSAARYGIDMVLPAAVTGVPQRLILEGDGSNQPHLMCYYATQLTGSSNLTDPLVWYDAAPADGGASWRGTARGLIQDTNGNLFFISTAEGGSVGTRYGLWLCRGPWFTTPVLLEELPVAWPLFGKTYESGAYLINYRYRITRPKFNGQ